MKTLNELDNNYLEDFIELVYSKGFDDPKVVGQIKEFKELNEFDWCENEFAMYGMGMYYAALEAFCVMKLIYKFKDLTDSLDFRFLMLLTAEEMFQQLIVCEWTDDYHNVRYEDDLQEALEIEGEIRDRRHYFEQGLDYDAIDFGDPRLEGLLP